MKTKMVSIAAGLLLAVPAVLAGCQGDGASLAPVSSETASETVVSSAVSEGEAPAAVQPEPFTAADNTFSVVLPEGFVEQNNDPSSGTTTWLHPKKGITLVATSVKQGGLQPDSFTQEAMAQTLSVTYEQAEIKEFTQEPKGDGTLFTYEAEVMQNGQAYYLIQALYADADQTVTLVLTLQKGQEEEGRTIMESLAESLNVL